MFLFSFIIVKKSEKSEKVSLYKCLTFISETAAICHLLHAILPFYISFQQPIWPVCVQVVKHTIIKEHWTVSQIVCIHFCQCVVFFLQQEHVKWFTAVWCER